MQSIIHNIQTIDWKKSGEEMHIKGYTTIPKLLTATQCLALRSDYDQPGLYRKTVVMARHRFGLGEYKYFDYPLPDIVRIIRSMIYPHLVPIANAWFRTLNIDRQFPPQHEELLQYCHENGQQEATALILKYGQGGFNTLHQDLYGDIYFPIQLVLFLNEPDKDFTGGEFVLTKQMPRAQSKAIVLTPRQGDMLVFATNFKPERGKRGYYKVNIKHGVSEVTSGERHTLGIIFHDATR